MSGWTGSTRRLRLPPGWAQIRIQRLRLDGFRCQWPIAPGVICGAAATDVDHIEAMTDDHAIEALRSLCAPHHRGKSSSEGGRASGQQAKRRAQARYRPQKRHPGIL